MPLLSRLKGQDGFAFYLTHKNTFHFRILNSKFIVEIQNMSNGVFTVAFKETKEKVVEKLRQADVKNYSILDNIIFGNLRLEGKL